MRSVRIPADRNFREFAAGAANDELADFVGNSHGFDDGKTASVAGIFAALATTSSIQRYAIHDARIYAQIRIHFRRVSDWFLAVGTYAPHQALGTRENDRRRNQEWRNTHVVKTRNRAGRVITVHRAEHLMPGQGGFDRNFRRFRRTDPYTIRILPQNRTQCIGKM
jgi:hypothetical protein